MIRFIVADDRVEEVTGYEFHRKVLCFASYLKDVLRLQTNDRVLILYPPGMDYVYSLYGCVWAGVIAVPAYPPDYRNSDRILSIIKDCNPAVILTQESIRERISTILDRAGAVDVPQGVISIPEEYVPDPAFRYTAGHRDDTVFLQYTSGSTAAPKGVELSHGNVISNARYIHRAMRSTEDSVMVTWVPPYHDMGLIGGLAYPFIGGMTAVVMSPLFFIKNPLRWLKAISDITTSDHVITAAPNFGYELCCNKISDEAVSELTLDHFKLALCGAEPIRVETFERFSRKFEKAGFQRNAFTPVYGLAEATVMVSGGQPPEVTVFDRDMLRNNIVSTAGNDSLLADPARYHAMLGCGNAEEELGLRIVDPGTCAVCAPEQVGEIWVRGEGVAKGYWNNAVATTLTFNAFTVDGEGPFLRTGDLGFQLGEQLYISGRLKDCIIVSGQNHYPQDIETTISNLHTLLRKDCTAVFSVDGLMSDRAESVVAIQEVVRHQHGMDYAEVSQLIKREVFQKHSLALEKIIFIEQSSIPKTSSGKIQRGKARQLFLEGKLNVVAIG